MTKEEQKNSFNDKLIVGIILIVIGIFILLVQAGTIQGENFWTLLIAGIGIAFFAGYLMNREQFGLLMPGSILTIIGVLFFYLAQTDWDQMEFLWPTFILAPGIGFFLMNFATGGKKKFYIPGLILTVVAIAFYIRFWQILQFWPYLLIAIGLYLVLKNISNRKTQERSVEK